MVCTIDGSLNESLVVGHLFLSLPARVPCNNPLHPSHDADTRYSQPRGFSGPLHKDLKLVEQDLKEREHMEIDTTLSHSKLKSKVLAIPMVSKADVDQVRMTRCPDRCG